MYSRAYIFPLALCCVSLGVHAQPFTEEEALTRAFGSEDFISIATGARQPISLAPAVASVITAEQMREMGARDLDEVLQSVPGLHVSVAPRGYLPLYTIRGIYSENNPQVLVLINDIPITNFYVGNRGELWGGMPLNDIARIEIIRGPGSAIYGADAFAGVVNIITKTAEDIDGTEVGVRAGSFSTKEGWMLHGGTWNNFDISFSLQVQDTDGHGEIIDADAQSASDAFFSTDASYAPGPVNLQRKSIETRVDVSRGSWRLRLGYQGRKDMGSGAGVAMALDPAANGDSERFNADLTYRHTLTQSWDLTSVLSYFDTSAEPDLVLFPPGAGAGAFPDGVIARPYVYERHMRLNLSAFYHGFERHSLRFGTGATYGDMYRIREVKNYAPDGSPLPGGVIDVSNDPDLVFIRPNDRKIYYAFAQDEWMIAPDWRLTSGVRYDKYSDFGDTTNPRFALVWQARMNLTAKLLYGRAFRAPAFNELYNINNPVALGNPNLKPETIDTYELALSHQYSHDLKMGLNIFHYEMKDILRFTPDPAPALTVTAQNAGNRRGHGLEVEVTYDPSLTIHLYGNYSFQKSTETETDNDVANSPQHQAYILAGWKFIPDWTLNAETYWVADRKREASDPRPEIDDYVVSNLLLRYMPRGRSWDVAFAARNVFDEDAREPSPAPGSIPNDLPLAGRHFFVEGRYQF